MSGFITKREILAHPILAYRIVGIKILWRLWTAKTFLELLR